MKILSGLLITFFFVYGIFPCTVNISNIKTSAVYGKVVDETKEIIPNAKIQIYKNTDDGEEILAETTADGHGRFEIKNFPAGKYMIRAKAEHFAYSFASMKLKKSSSSAKNREIVFTLVFECSGWVEMQKIQTSK